MASPIPSKNPVGDVSGVLKSPWASNQMTPTSRPTPATVPSEVKQLTARTSGKRPSATAAVCSIPCGWESSERASFHAACRSSHAARSCPRAFISALATSALATGFTTRASAQAQSWPTLASDDAGLMWGECQGSGSSPSTILSACIACVGAPRLAVRLRVQARPEQLDPAADGTERRAAGSGIDIFHCHIVKGAGIHLGKLF